MYVLKNASKLIIKKIIRTNSLWKAWKIYTFWSQNKKFSYCNNSLNPFSIFL